MLVSAPWRVQQPRKTPTSSISPPVGLPSRPPRRRMETIGCDHLTKCLQAGRLLPSRTERQERIHTRTSRVLLAVKRPPSTPCDSVPITARPPSRTGPHGARGPGHLAPRILHLPRRLRGDPNSISPRHGHRQVSGAALKGAALACGPLLASLILTSPDLRTVFQIVRARRVPAATGAAATGWAGLLGKGGGVSPQWLLTEFQRKAGRCEDKPRRLPGWR